MQLESSELYAQTLEINCTGAIGFGLETHASQLASYRLTLQAHWSYMLHLLVSGHVRHQSYTLRPWTEMSHTWVTGCTARCLSKPAHSITA